MVVIQPIHIYIYSFYLLHQINEICPKAYLSVVTKQELLPVQPDDAYVAAGFCFFADVWQYGSVIGWFGIRVLLIAENQPTTQKRKNRVRLIIPGLYIGKRIFYY